MSTRVALIGASGIGKHHGKWWALEGAEVCAFAGTSAESVARTREVLAKLIGFEGRGYTDVATMLREERPDVVDVCSPGPCHAEHVRAALEAGCHVLCEKPFVYDPALPTKRLMEQARSLVALAKERHRRLDVCTQYSVGARHFRRLWEAHRGGEAITAYHGHLEAPAKGRGPDPRRIWVDLAPHLISALLELVPGAAVRWDSLEMRFDGYEAIAAFDVGTPQGAAVACEIYTRNRTQPPSNIRHFRLNGYLFDVQGFNDANGIFRARIVTPDATAEEPDMMHLLIRDTMAGKAPAAEEAVLGNLAIMLGVLDRAGKA